MSDEIIKCRICGKPYRFFAFSAANQSACPACIEEANTAILRPSNASEIERRRKYFGN